MNDGLDVAFDRDLDELFGRGPRTAPPATLASGLARAGGTAQRRPVAELLDRKAWPSKARSASDPAVHRLARLALAAVVVVLLAAVIAFGARLLDRPPRVTVVPAGALEARLGGPAAALWPDGRILVTSQENGGYLFDLATGSSERISFGDALGSSDVHVLADGRVLLIGSSDRSNGILPKSVALYDLTTGDIHVLGQIPGNRPLGESTLVLHDGRILLTGGTVLPGDEVPCRPEVCGGPPTPTQEPKVVGDLATVRLLDPATWRETTLPPLQQPRFLHSTIELDDGRVLIAGGNRSVRGDEWVLEVEVYDLATGQSRVVGSITQPSYFPGGPALVALGDGRVLIPGGVNVEFPCGPPEPPRPSSAPAADDHIVYRQNTFIFDPRSNSIIEGPVAPHPSPYRGIGLGDGRALLFGGYGYTPGGCAGASSEVKYWLGVADPRRNVVDESYSPVAATSLALDVEKQYVGGLRLPDGRLVLISQDDEHPFENQFDIATIGP